MKTEFVVLLLSFFQFSASQRVGETICIEGFVMDGYCLYRNGNPSRLLDTNDVTLRSPDQHTYHCLLDVSLCLNTDFHILAEPTGGSSEYTVAYRVDSTGKNRLIAAGRGLGRPGSYPACSECTGDPNGPLKGFRAEVTGEVTSLGDGTNENPPTLRVLTVEASHGRSNFCQGFPLEQTPMPTKSPTRRPTALPTRSPTTPPTSPPSKSPTLAPAESETEMPFAAPTSAPVATPTTGPETEMPFAAPTSAPVATPTTGPSTSSPVAGTSSTNDSTEMPVDTSVNDLAPTMTPNDPLTSTNAPSNPLPGVQSTSQTTGPSAAVSSMFSVVGKTFCLLLVTLYYGS